MQYEGIPQYSFEEKFADVLFPKDNELDWSSAHVLGTSHTTLGNIKATLPLGAITKCY